MHELSVALSLMDVITESLIRSADADARATRVTVEVGELSGVEPAALATAFKSVVTGSDLAGCTIDLVVVPVAIRCDRCSADTAARGPSDLHCTVCGTPAASVVHGRELDVTSIAWEPSR